MSETNRSLFRADALQCYAQNKEKLVLPRLLSPAHFLWLWVLLGLLLGSGVVVWWMVAGHI